MTDKTKNTLIGLFVTLAVGAMIGLILFLEPQIGDGKKTIEVRFANIAGISVGTRVTFAGRPVGEVVAIRELSEARQEAPDESGRVYLYQLTLKLDSSATVYNTDEIAVRTTGLMGEKSVAILPRIAAKGKPSFPITNQILYANSIDPFENTVNQIGKVAHRLDGAVQHIDQWFLDNQARLTGVLESLDGALGQADLILGSVEAEKLVPAIREGVHLLNDNLRSVKTSLEDDQLLSRIAGLTDNFDKAVDTFNTEGAASLRNIHQITRDLSTGTGTIGRLINQEDFYLRMNSLMSKGETLMNDMNHYGILFQYNKQWQRGRTKRANILKSLDTPQEFRAYFEGEIDSMNTSLGRLTELVERAHGDGERSKVLHSEPFRKDFAVLMRQVQSLSDSIKLYNESLVAQSEME